MEEVCTCKVCKSQQWIIYKDKVECASCGKKYKFSEDDTAKELVNLTNDNF